MVGNANTLIGMGKEPAEVGFLAESESVLEMEGKRLVDFLLLRIVSLQKTMGGDDIARTNVKAKLMADQGMADAVVPLSDDCLGFQICVDCRIYQKAKEYGHSVRREICFLVAHSMLHLLGYDHMEDEERLVMEAKQKEVLDTLGITRN